MAAAVVYRGRTAITGEYSMRLHTTCLSACALAAAALASPAQAADIGGGYHVMYTPEYKAAHNIPDTPPPATQMLYYGGSVLANSKVISVIWGNNVNPTTVATVPGFSAALGNSTYTDQMAEYSTKGQKTVNGHKSTKQIIGRGTYLGQTQITPNNKSTNLSDADVQAELKFQIKAGVLPHQDLNTLYMVYFPDNITITLDGLVSCQQFGAYHFAVNDTKLSKGNLFYSVEPGCHYGIQNITFAASHEFAEATTDNVPTPGSNPAFPQAWNTSDGYEIADLCGGSGTLTSADGTYTVSQYFLNSTGRCSTSNYTSP
jgi:hypothetical protein